MHWWQSAFSSSPSPSSSSSSSSSSSQRHSYNSLFSSKSRGPSLFSWQGRGFRFRFQQRRLTRSKKLPHLGDSDLAQPSNHWRSSNAAPPRPLPLPDLDTLLRRDAARITNFFPSSSANIPLPSPKEVPGRGVVEERDGADTLNGDASAFASRLGSQDARRNTEQSETQLSRKLPQVFKGIERLADNCALNTPITATSSAYSSPALSPPRNTGDFLTYQCMSPQVIQVWSAPEMPPSDMNLGLGYPYQMSPEKIAFSVDSSPIQSPIVSPREKGESTSGSASSSHNKLPVEIPKAWRESNAQANVHPLPRPPGVSITLQPAPIRQVSAKAELIPLQSQWQKGKLIGRGTFGSVYVASNRETGALCAMKEVELLPDDPISAESIRQLEQEIEVLSQLKHPNIVRYYGSEIVGDRFYIYLEYVHPGSINKYIRDHCEAITESVVRNFTRHILSGLAYLHSTKTIHRDIKGANLLVDAYGVVKLADFGMAKHLTGQAANLSLKGSPYWMAPELLHSVMQKDANSDLALGVDIWSLGCTIIEMLNGKPPWSEYEGAAAMFKVLRETPPIPETLSPEGKDFLLCCFRRDPAERPSASMLLEHRFLKNSQQPDVLSCTHSLNEMKLTDKAQTQRECPRYRLDHLQVSPDTQTAKGKLVNNERFQRSHHETSNLTVVSHHSPRSALEAVLILSPPHSANSTNHPSPSANVPSSTRQDAGKNCSSE